jgi:DNA-binding transcriptional MerR regulator
MRYPYVMDHLQALREKIGRLRSEIADIQELNEQYRFQGQKLPDAETAHRQRQERLQEIQEELVQLSRLGQKTLSIEEMRERHRARLHLAKNAS